MAAKSSDRKFLGLYYRRRKISFQILNVRERDFTFLDEFIMEKFLATSPSTCKLVTSQLRISV